MRWITVLCCILLLTAYGSPVFADGVSQAPPAMSSIPLVSGGQPKATIILAANATTTEQQAAQELHDYIIKISGADLPITSAVYGVVNGESRTKIFIGQSAPDVEGSKAAIAVGGDNPDSFRILAAGNSIQLNGLSDQGTLYAAYDLLEQLGVRWFMPGEIGTVIPTKDTVSIREQDTIQHPSFDIRMQKPDSSYQTLKTIPYVYNKEEMKPWAKHMRLIEWNVGAQSFPCKITNKQRPDLFLKNDKGQVTGHIDVTKPEVLDCVVQGSLEQLTKTPDLKYLSMSPIDGVPQVINPDPDWDAVDYDALNGTKSTTDRYIKFVNLVLERLDAAGYPKVKIVLFAYSSYMRPPVRWTPDQRIVPLIAPITVERIHAIGNDLSWERNYLGDIIDGWQALGVKALMYDYRFDLADPGLPFPMINQAASELKYYKEKGLLGAKAEVLPAWGYQGPALYLDAKMKWNTELDVQTLLTDYFEKLYGPAAKPMREHFDDLEKAFAEADYFTGNIYDFPHILTSKVMKDLEKSLSKAEKNAEKSSDPMYAKRVHMVRVAFDFGNTFLEMMDSINRFDFIKAKQQLDDIRRLRFEAISHSPVILSPWASYLYTDDFWTTIVEDAYRRVTNGGRIVAKLPDEWSAMLFPDKHGDQLGLWKPELGLQSWMKLKTYSETWSDQGLRYFKGDVWYRTTVTLPTTYNNGHPIWLWFGNIDETARVWVNGKELPVVQQGSALMKPWVFDASNAVIFDRPNVIVVDTHNEILDELGTGGIAGPAMFYQPGE